MIKYIVTIKTVETVQTTKRDYEKLADSGNERDNGAVYGYVEYAETEDTVIEVFSQRVNEEPVTPEAETLVTRVVRAINKV